MARVARRDAVHREQQRQVGRVEVGIPRRGAADGGPGTQIAFEQGRNDGRYVAAQRLDRAREFDVRVLRQEQRVDDDDADELDPQRQAQREVDRDAAGDDSGRVVGCIGLSR